MDDPQIIQSDDQTETTSNDSSTNVQSGWIEGKPGGSVQWEIDRLAQESRDATNRLGSVDDDLRLLKKQAERIPAMDEALRQLRDLAAVLRQSLDSIAEQQERQIAFRSAELEHERRLQSETQQTMSDLGRIVESVQTRTQVMAEEIRRNQSAIVPLGQSTEELSRKLTALSTRLVQFDDFARRFDARTAAIEQRETQHKEDVMRLDNWQRLADIRWNRQFAEATQAHQSVSEQSGEYVKTIQATQRLIQRNKEDVEKLSSASGDHQRLLDQQTAELRRIEGLAVSGIDAAARVAGIQEAMQRRIDEHSDSLIRVEEGVQRAMGRVTELERQIDAQRLRSDGLLVQIRGAESHLEAIDRSIETIQRQIGDLSVELSDTTTKTEDRLNARIGAIADTLTEFVRSQAALAQRRVALAEQEADALRSVSVASDPVGRSQ